MTRILHLIWSWLNRTDCPDCLREREETGLSMAECQDCWEQRPW